MSHSIDERHADEADEDDHPTVENIETHQPDPDFRPNLKIEGRIPESKILYDSFLIKVLGGSLRMQWERNNVQWTMNHELNLPVDDTGNVTYHLAVDVEKDFG